MPLAQPVCNSDMNDTIFCNYGPADDASLKVILDRLMKAVVGRLPPDVSPQRIKYIREDFRLLLSNGLIRFSNVAGRMNGNGLLADPVLPLVVLPPNVLTKVKS